MSHLLSDGLSGFCCLRLEITGVPRGSRGSRRGLLVREQVLPARYLELPSDGVKEGRFVGSIFCFLLLLRRCFFFFFFCRKRWKRELEEKRWKRGENQNKSPGEKVYLLRVLMDGELRNDYPSVIRIAAAFVCMSLLNLPYSSFELVEHRS